MNTWQSWEGRNNLECVSEANAFTRSVAAAAATAAVDLRTRALGHLPDTSATPLTSQHYV